LKLFADYNRKGALELLSVVKNGSKETKFFLNNIIDHIIHSDYEEAENETAAFISKIMVSA